MKNLKAFCLLTVFSTVMQLTFAVETLNLNVIGGDHNV
jgi:hypothetical protein